MRNNPAASRPPIAAALACLWLLSGFWFLDSYNSAADEFSFYDKIYAGGLVVFVLFAQSLLILLFHFFAPLRSAVNFLLSFFAIINIYFLNLILIDGFYNMNKITQALVLAAGAAVAFGFFSSLGENRLGRIGAAAAAFLLFGWAAAEAAVYEWRSYALPKKNGAEIGGATSAPGIKIPAFIDKPDVYFISFDGLLAQPLAEKYITPGELPYHAALKRHGFRIFKNHFSSAPDTRRSLNKFLAMDEEFYYSLPKQKRGGMTAGRVSAPLYEIFKANGYATYFNNFNHYFGAGGPHVDHYIIPPRLFSFCTLMQDDRALYIFFTFCPMLTLMDATGFLNFADVRFRTRSIYREDDLRAMLAMYSEARLDEGRKVFLSYVFLPGHTWSPYHFLRPETHNTYVRKFTTGAEMAAHAVDEIMRSIKQSARPALIYIFGDHGPWFSNGLKWNNANEEQRKFIIQDRHGVIGALYPADACAEYFGKPFAAGYTTPTEVARQIIRCLAGGEDPATRPLNYPLYYDKKGYQGDEKGDFADYLYE